MDSPVFGLRKSWVDPGPGISMVQVHYTWAPDASPPDFQDAAQEVLVASPDRPGLRSAVLELPRSVDGSLQYWLYHFFFVVADGGRFSSPVFGEEVVCREITHTDPSGAFTFMGIAWSTPDAQPALEVANYTGMAMDGLPFDARRAATEPSDVYEFALAQPLPHVFRGPVWGVRGSTIRYVLHRVRHGSPDPADDTEDWLDNDGAPWTLELT